MSVATFSIVMFAALLHAVWNAIVKGAGDKTVMLGLIAFGHVVPALGLVAMYPVPAWEAFPYIVASTVIHWGYYYLLNIGYRTGDLSVVYPIARGLAPVLVALGAQIWVGETLPMMAWVGILCVSFGIMVLTRNALRQSIAMGAILSALGTAVLIAAYSLVDGVGVRLAGTPLGYVGWLFAAEIFVAGYIFLTRWERLTALPAKTIWVGFLGGVVSGTAYGLVLYAKTLAPLGIISALRETSVIFAALIGVMWFGEGPKRDRIIAALVVSIGIVLIASVS